MASKKLDLRLGGGSGANIPDPQARYGRYAPNTAEPAFAPKARKASAAGWTPGDLSFGPRPGGGGRGMVLPRSVPYVNKLNPGKK